MLLLLHQCYYMLQTIKVQLKRPKYLCGRKKKTYTADGDQRQV